MRSQNWEGVELGVNVPFRDTTRDVDVYGHRNLREIARVVECKAARADSELDAAEVSKFYQETVPAFLAAKVGGTRVSQCDAEIWTTGAVGQRARECLASIELDGRVQPTLVGGKELIDSVPRALERCRELLRVICLEI
jgi:hypothetical protein